MIVRIWATRAPFWCSISFTACCVTRTGTTTAAGADGTLEDLIKARSNETIDWYHDDMDALGALRPNSAPRATEFIAEMITMIEDLIAKGHAYAAEGHVLFKVRSYAEYGKLSGRSFDIHGGGNDLTFPHHENEIAQSTCAGHDFANIWMHNEMLNVEGKKMSKSLGNFFTVRDLLDQGVPGEVIRFVMLSTHYRKPMDWTEKKRQEAEKTLKKLRARIDAPDDTATAPDDFMALISDDLNISGAMALLQNYTSSADISGALNMLGFSLTTTQSDTTDLLPFQKYLSDARETAMVSKDFSEVDRIKSALTDAGLEVRMSKTGVDLEPLPNFDPTKLEGLL